MEWKHMDHPVKVPVALVSKVLMLTLFVDIKGRMTISFFEEKKAAVNNISYSHLPRQIPMTYPRIYICEKSTDFHTEKKGLFFREKIGWKDIICVAVFLHLLTNQRLHASLKFPWYFSPTILAAKNLKDQNPK